MEFLEHPDVRWWTTSDDHWTLVANGARDGCLVCKAELYSHLTIFADYEDEKKPDASLLREKWLDEIKTNIKNVPPFRALLAMLALPRLIRTTFFDTETMARACDSRVFRFCTRIPSILKKLPKPEKECADWLFYQREFEKASQLGSLEATLSLARDRTRPFDERQKYYQRAYITCPGAALELAECQRNQGLIAEAKATLMELGNRGEKLALTEFANLEFHEMKGTHEAAVHAKKFCIEHKVPLSSSTLLPAIREEDENESDEQYLKRFSE